jgi:hypothetical protein
MAGSASIVHIASFVRKNEAHQTLNFTALVHEAWLKLKNSPPFAAKPLTKFKAIAANAVRQVLGGGGSDKADRAVHGRSFRGRRRRGGAFGGFEGSHCD